MTGKSVPTACLAFSLFAHFLLVHVNWTSTTVHGAEQVLMPADFDVAPLPSVDTLNLNQAVEQETGRDCAENSDADKGRRTLRQYITWVREAIEQRKFQPDRQGLEGLIGNARYAFTITAEGAFTDIKLTRTSGDALLDRTALLGILAASGVVKRPKITGRSPLSVTVAVKYQHSL
jgi:protein TonB